MNQQNRSAYQRRKSLLALLLALAMVLSVVQPVSAATGGSEEVTITQVDAARFPDEINLYVRVTDQDGNHIPGLTADDFEVTEKSELESSPTVQHPVDLERVSEASTLSLGLVVDTSGSMRWGTPEPMGLAKDAAKNFLQQLDYDDGDRAAVIEFESVVRVVQSFTGNETDLLDAVDGLRAWGGTAMYSGILGGLDEIQNETGSKALIVFADGDNNTGERNIQRVIDEANRNNIPIYTIGLGNHVQPGPLQRIAAETGGMYEFAPTADQMEDIFNSIARTQRDQYLLRYRTHNTAFDGTERQVAVTYRGAEGTGTYRVNKAPDIELTRETEALKQNGAPVGASLTIGATVTDDQPITEVRLYYRQLGGSGSYQQAEMTASGDVYSYTLPAGDVARPGVDFYIAASNADVTATSPRSNPSRNPHQIAVGNEPPDIVHTPVEEVVKTTAGVNDIRFEATVTDPDGDRIESVMLYYRDRGRLSYSSAAMTASGSDYGYTLSGSEISVDGLEYYLTAADQWGSRSGSGTADAPHVVEVRPVTQVQDITVSPKTLTMRPEEAPEKLTADITPVNADNQSVTWASSDPEVASVDANGKVTPQDQGTATITATAHNGLEDTAVVTVESRKVTGVSLNPDSLEFFLGGNPQQLTPVIAPADADNQRVTWSSSDEEVAFVDQNGEVTPGIEGDATITVTTVDGGFEARAAVTVERPQVVSLQFSPEEIALTPDSRVASGGVGPDADFQLWATYENGESGYLQPSDASWKLDDENAARLIEDGVVVALVDEGEAVLTAEVDGVEATLSILMTTGVADVTGVYLDKTQLTMIIDDQEQLTATVLPANAGNKQVRWESSDTSVANVVDGKVIARGAGEAEITVTTVEGGFTDTCTVTVEDAIGIRLNPSELTMTLDDFPQTLQAEVWGLEEGAEIIWSNSSPMIVAMDFLSESQRRITPMREGEAVITARVAGREATALIRVVSDKVTLEGFQVTPDRLLLEPGGTPERLRVTPQPSNADINRTEWVSDNRPVATVMSNGTVTPISAGAATITVTVTGHFGESFTKDIDVTVARSVAVTGITLDKEEVVMPLGGTETLVATVEPPDAVNRRVRWESSDEAIVFVNQRGNLTALGEGNATITATTVEGQRRATARVEVTAPPALIPSDSELNMKMGEGREVFVYEVQADGSRRDITTEMTWSSEDATKVSVNNQGIVSAHRETGLEEPVRITATWRDAQVTVRVFVNGEVDRPVTGVDVTPRILNMELGNPVSEVTTVSAIVLPHDADNKEVRWSSEDINVAVVDQDGKVIAVGPGNTTITAVSQDNPTAFGEIPVNVSGDPSNVPVAVRLDQVRMTLEAGGESARLNATVLPREASNKDVTWSSGNNAVASVDENGVVTPRQTGTTNITVTTAEGGHQAYAQITVVHELHTVTDIDILPQVLTLDQGGPAGTLRALLNPHYASDSSIFWTSDRPGVAQVDDNGVVTPGRAGRANISANAPSGVIGYAQVIVAKFWDKTLITEEPQKTWTIEFSQAIDIGQTDINEAARLADTDELEIDARIELADNGREILITPAAPLEPGDYMIIIDAEYLKSDTGEPLDTSIKAMFTVK